MRPSIRAGWIAAIIAVFFVVWTGTQHYFPLPLETPGKNSGKSPDRVTDHPESVRPPVLQKGKTALPTPPERPFTLLFIGVDQRKKDQGRADALMFISLNPRQKTMKVLNIPRDTKARLQLQNGQSRFDKINHAYALGQGVSSTVDTVETFLGVSVDDYVKVNMAGFRKLVDLFGGVDVQVNRSFSYKGHHFQKGSMTLNGAEALAYVRDRTASSDFDRHRRQQQVMKSLWRKATRPSSIFKVRDFMRILTRHVDTSMTFRDFLKIYAAFNQMQEKGVEVIRLKGTDEWADRYYFVVSQEEKKRVRDIFLRHLNTNEKHS
ncbi:LCP family protein [Paludifilum halophilum]|uniref:Cell envelope-related transcriptional attenuator domain-containing protein n=1 Tax=Paludifilum halophilum TaxID=1642702 RepID=A0A235B741_9BACL|nr:LCP family protein [Paludifilum halophilum]OYD08051.1 hypothetical protein CHM34_08025 [Paludifilum halophilum]